MKKALSLILSLVMLLSVTAGLSFNAYAGEITKVDITLPDALTPVAGTTANSYDLSTITVSREGSDLFNGYALNTSATAYQVKSGSSWISVSPTDTFEVGKTYRVKIACGANGNNDTHSDNVSCTINGVALSKETGEIDSTADFFYLNGTKRYAYAYYYYGMLTAEISTVTITGAPEAELGKDVVINPYAYKIDSNLEFTNIAIEAKDGTTWKTATKYECNTKYRFVIDIKTAAGYYLKNNFSATVKTDIANRYANKTEIKDGGKAGTIYCEFPNVPVAHTYGTEGDARFTCTVCDKVDEELKAKYAPALLANPLSVKGKTVKVKKATVKKKNVAIKRSKAITVKNAQGKVTYTKKSGNKKIVINKKTGKITVKKGLKKGTYKVKVVVKAAGNESYKAAKKTATVKIVVK